MEKTVMQYVIHTKEDAPSAARANLERVEQKYGFIPNLSGMMAQAPGLLHAYLEVEGAFRASSLSPAEQEVVGLTVSARNGCRYCMSGHSMLATMSGVGMDDLEALRSGRPLATPRLDALRRFTTALLDARGAMPPEHLEAFLAAGFTLEQAMAVPLGIAFKTLSNLTHHLQPVPIDTPLEPFAWEPSSNGGGTRILITGWVRKDGQKALADYQAGAGPLMSRHGGRPVLKSTPVSTYVGSKPDLVVMMNFPSSGAAAAAFQDPDYAALVPLRDQAFARLDVTDLP